MRENDINCNPIRACNTTQASSWYQGSCLVNNSQGQYDSKCYRKLMKTLPGKRFSTNFFQRPCCQIIVDVKICVKSSGRIKCMCVLSNVIHLSFRYKTRFQKSGLLAVAPPKTKDSFPASQTLRADI